MRELDLTRRDLFRLVPATLAALAGLETGGAAAAEVAVEGGEYQQLYGELALELLKRNGWYQFVANNVGIVDFNYSVDWGSELKRIPSSTRCRVSLNPRFTMHPLSVAQLLVHESVHQCLYNHGLGYEAPQWQTFPYDGRVRPWQLQEFAASLVQQVFVECVGGADSAYRRPEDLW